jgi:hypothetical protein
MMHEWSKDSFRMRSLFLFWLSLFSCCLFLWCLLWCLSFFCKEKRTHRWQTQRQSLSTLLSFSRECVSWNVLLTVLVTQGWNSDDDVVGSWEHEQTFIWSCGCFSLSLQYLSFADVVIVLFWVSMSVNYSDIRGENHNLWFFASWQTCYVRTDCNVVHLCISAVAIIFFSRSDRLGLYRINVYLMASYTQLMSHVMPIPCFCDGGSRTILVVLSREKCLFVPEKNVYWRLSSWWLKFMLCSLLEEQLFSPKVRSTRVGWTIRVNILENDRTFLAFITRWKRKFVSVWLLKSRESLLRSNLLCCTDGTWPDSLFGVGSIPFSCLDSFSYEMFMQMCRKADLWYVAWIYLVIYARDIQDHHHDTLVASFTTSTPAVSYASRHICFPSFL